MENTFGVLALLPLALASFFSRDLRRGASAGFLPLLAALAPVIASGVGSLVKHKQAGSVRKQEEALVKQQADQAEAERKATFEAAQGSPSALAGRQKFTLQLGKLLGAAGGKEKVPPSIYNYLNQQRQAQAYTPGTPYAPPPKKGGGFWDFLGGAGEALSYLDTSRLKPRTTSVGQPTGFGAGSSFKTGQVKSLLQPQNPAASPLAVTSTKRQSFY